MKATLMNKNEQCIPHLGYMGHLINISNAILRSSKVHSAIYYLLEDIPNRGWKKFVDGKLKNENILRDKPVPGVSNLYKSNSSGFSSMFGGGGSSNNSRKSFGID